MTTDWRIHEDARAEIDATVDWYDEQRPGLGLEFVAELRRTLTDLRARPGAAAPDRSATRELKLRRRRVRRFPYAVVFIETPTEFVVVAVMHLRRRPGYWLSRVDDAD